jgi:hypothetical protein
MTSQFQRKLDAHFNSAVSCTFPAETVGCNWIYGSLAVVVLRENKAGEEAHTTALRTDSLAGAFEVRVCFLSRRLFDEACLILTFIASEMWGYNESALHSHDGSAMLSFP